MYRDANQHSHDSLGKRQHSLSAGPGKTLLDQFRTQAILLEVANEVDVALPCCCCSSCYCCCFIVAG